MDVALRKESVDRNQVAVHFDTLSAVALRKESVDRNVVVLHDLIKCTVALRKESVDRNIVGPSAYRTSSSSRSPQGERG